MGYHRAGSSPASATDPKRPISPRKRTVSLRLSRGFPPVFALAESCESRPDECKSLQKLTLSGEYDGTRNGTFFEQLGTTVGTAKMRVAQPSGTQRKGRSAEWFLTAMAIEVISAARNTRRRGGWGDSR